MRDSFLQYMKIAENAQLFHTGSPVRHTSPEGGNDTIGYGHKLNVLEDQVGQVYGIRLDELDESACDAILRRDLMIKEDNLRQRWSRAKWNSLTEKQQEMMIDFEFNVGHVEKTFPLFTHHMLTNNVDGMRDEYKRYYRDEKKRVKPLEERNRLFYERYLA